MSRCLLLSLLLSGLRATVIDLGEGQCCSLEEQKRILGVNGVNTFMLEVNLDTLLSTSILQSYQKNNDIRGLNCLLNMTARVNNSILDFKRKIGKFERENGVTRQYLNEYAVSKTKRFEPGSMALVISLFTFASSMAGVILTQTQIGQMDARLSIMARHIDHLRDAQAAMNENIDFIHDESEFLGVSNSIFLNFLNAMKAHYSCDFFSVFFEYNLSVLERRLDTIFQSIVNRKLTLDLIDHDSLEKVVNDRFFYDMIYLFNPSVLYELAQVDIVSLRKNKLLLLITFPVIERTFSFKRISVLESPMDLMMTRNLHERFYSFLVPDAVNLSVIGDHLSDIRVGQNCLITANFEACDSNSYFAYSDMLCISGILNGLDTHCAKRKSFVFDFNIEYGKHSALIHLKNDARIIDTVSRTILYQGTSEMAKCVYLHERDGLIVESIFRKEKLFKDRKKFLVKAKLPKFVIPTQETLANLSMPIRNHTKTYKPIVFSMTSSGLSIYMIIGIAIGSALFVLMILFILCYCRTRHQAIEGQSIFPE